LLTVMLTANLLTVMLTANLLTVMLTANLLTAIGAESDPFAVVDVDSYPFAFTDDKFISLLLKVSK